MHIVIGTPCYGGMICSEYATSLFNLQTVFTKLNIKMSIFFLANESLIQRARNTITHVYLKGDADYLMFIDADQNFDPKDILKMIDADKGIIGGAVPMKGINWENVRRGALDNYSNLEELTGIFNVNHLPGHKMVDSETPFQVKHVGTGFMLIARHVFDTLKPDVGWYYRNDERVYDFFKVQNVNNELLSEDYNFCHMYRESGGTVWLAPWCKLGHLGSYAFNGQYSKAH
jgi:hypothetical protein